MKKKNDFKSENENMRPASWFMFLGIFNNCHYTSEEYILLRNIENLFNYLY